MQRLVIILLFTNVQLFGQNKIVLKSGDLISFETVDFPNGGASPNEKIKYTTPQNEIVEISQQDFNGIHYWKTGLIFYWRKSKTQTRKCCWWWSRSQRIDLVFGEG
jgi:hypothetical protein